MASRYEVEVTISSAKDLKNVNWRHGSLKPYAVVWVDPNNKCTTKVAEYGDTCPEWDQTLVIPLPGRIDDDTTLYIDIVHAVGSNEDTKPFIGWAKLKLVEILDDVGIGERAKRNLQLKRSSGRPHGKLDVKVTVRDPHYRAPDAYYASSPYGVPPPQQQQHTSSREYVAPPSQYGNPYGAAAPNPYYAAAPPSGYPSSAYNAPQQYGQPSYGYGQQPSYGQQGVYGQEEKKSSKFGGMGTGLAVGAVAGVLGGLALSEGIDAVEDHIADEAADRVEDDLGDGGYDGDDF